MKMVKPDDQQFPPQHQNNQPGLNSEMKPDPLYERDKSAETLQNKVALITGGDSGIGRAVAIAFAQEGADTSIVYLDEYKDAQETRKKVEEKGRRCILISGD